jgi:hypothetical protein
LSSQPHYGACVAEFLGSTASNFPKFAFSIGGKTENSPSDATPAELAQKTGIPNERHRYLPWKLRCRAKASGTLFTLRAAQSNSAILATSVNTRRNAWHVWVFDKRNKNCHNSRSIIGDHGAITERNPRIMLRGPPLSRSDMYR